MGSLEPNGARRCNLLIPENGMSLRLKEANVNERFTSGVLGNVELVAGGGAGVLRWPRDEEE